MRKTIGFVEPARLSVDGMRRMLAAVNIALCGDRRFVGVMVSAVLYSAGSRGVC